MTSRAPTRAMRTVGDVAELSGVTVRTLHHYDRIGLLVPSGRTSSGYRLYTDTDVERLRHIVVYRRLGFSLGEVAEMLRADRGDVVAHLRRQRAAVQARLEECHHLVDAIDRALERAMTDHPATAEELEELFGGRFDDYQDEAQQRWGDTDAWRQSAQRTSRYSGQEWTRINAESRAITERFAAALRAGLPATSEQAVAAAEEHRRHIQRWFYDVDHDMHRGLSELYVVDERFAKHYDDVAAGLAPYVREAIHANADRHTRPGPTPG